MPLCACGRPVTPCHWIDPDQPGLYIFRIQRLLAKPPSIYLRHGGKLDMSGLDGMRTERIWQRGWSVRLLPKRTALDAQSPSHPRGQGVPLDSGELTSRLRGWQLLLFGTLRALDSTLASYAPERTAHRCAARRSIETPCLHQSPRANRKTAPALASLSKWMLCRVPQRWLPLDGGHFEPQRRHEQQRALTIWHSERKRDEVLDANIRSPRFEFRYKCDS